MLSFLPQRLAQSHLPISSQPSPSPVDPPCCVPVLQPHFLRPIAATTPKLTTIHPLLCLPIVAIFVIFNPNSSNSDASRRSIPYSTLLHHALFRSRHSNRQCACASTLTSKPLCFPQSCDSSISTTRLRAIHVTTTPPGSVYFDIVDPRCLLPFQPHPFIRPRRRRIVLTYFRHSLDLHSGTLRARARALPRP